METRRWINHSLPQTLGNAVILLYINAAFDPPVRRGPVPHRHLLIAGGKVAAGYGIANERKWGYQLGLVMAFLPFVVRFLFSGLDGVLGTSIISLHVRDPAGRAPPPRAVAASTSASGSR